MYCIFLRYISWSMNYLGKTKLGFLIYFVKKLGYLNEIMKGVHKIKEGELNYKIEEKNDIYFSSLANDINNISEGLENSIEQRIKK